MYNPPAERTERMKPDDYLQTIQTSISQFVVSSRYKTVLVYSVLVCSANHWREVLPLLYEIRRPSESSLKWWYRRPSNQTKETRQAVIDNPNHNRLLSGFQTDDLLVPIR
jgi:hypothetical protein